MSGKGGRGETIRTGKGKNAAKEHGTLFAGLTAASVLAYLRAVHKPRKLDDMLRELRVPRKSKKIVQDILYDLEHGGDVSRLSGGAYVPAESLKTLSGVLELRGNGFAAVLPDSDRKGEVLVTPGNMGKPDMGAWQGDRVRVALFPARRGGNREGRIIEILEKGPRELAVRTLRSLKDGSVLCEALDARLNATFITDVSSLPQSPERGDILRIRITACESPGLWRATALVLLGNEDSLAVQEDIVKAAHGIATFFPEAALREAAAFAAAPDENSLAEKGRRDLSAIPFVTIDGEDAKDFDDAVHVAREADGFRLHVAIADVAHYVRPVSALDAEARRRGNSCYFPLSVEPMLPEKLSNGLCSLNPGVPRLVMAVEISFDRYGTPRASRLYPGVIRSAARLTYTQVRDAFGEPEDLPAEPGGPAGSGGLAVSSVSGAPVASGIPAASLPMLADALDLARLLSARRVERGSLDFDLPEPRYRFGPEGELLGIEPSRNSFANRLIEEFMVAANEAVARYLTEREYPILYRVHPAPDPDKLEALFSVVRNTGLGSVFGNKIPARPRSGDLQALLRAVKGTDREYLVGRLVLRSMMQAGYDPEWEGHYGLASECYCHFTSPIRRYADLVVHRALKAALGGADASPIPDKRALRTTAEHLRDCERAAVDAEREIAKRFGALYMRDKVGEFFDGIISGVTDFGIFVEFAAVMVEGMVRLSSLGDEYYIFNPERQELRGQRTGRAYTLGRKVRVRVADVSPARQEISLVFAPESVGGEISFPPGKDGSGFDPSRSSRSTARLPGAGRKRDGTYGKKSERGKKRAPARSDR